MMVQAGASDLHLSVGIPPMIRKDGKMQPLDPAAPVLNADHIVRLLDPITPEKNRKEFAETHDSDFAYEIPGLARFRANLFMDRKGRGGVFRVIPSKILTAEQLGLSAAILNLCRLSKGLVLVTGPTGSGKSTTLCAMVDHINQTRHDHIITIEDPIEFVHPVRKALINQREVGTHTGGFKIALRAALREDPDIVLVGEMRDLETVSIAIETAETGHLVFGTLHTNTAASTHSPRAMVNARALSATETLPAPSAQLQQTPFAARRASSRSFASRMRASRTATSISQATPNTMSL
jgi:twitching motility protein PilT